jgi:putative membrane protein
MRVQIADVLKRLALAAAIVAVVTGCDRGDRQRAAAEADTALGRVGEVARGAVDTISGRVTGREYTNAELVAFLNAFNDAEVEVGEMAQTKATDAQVRQFAQRIVGEHRALKTEATSTAQRLNITPAMPEDDEDLAEDHRDGMRDLEGRARGREFDEEFLEHEIEMHRKVLDEVEDALSGNRNEEIRSLLERARDGLRGHLTRAEELERKFGVV